MSYGNFTQEARFNEDGYIIYGKNIEEDDDTRLEYFADVTYSFNEVNDSGLDNEYINMLNPLMLIK